MEKTYCYGWGAKGNDAHREECLASGWPFIAMRPKGRYEVQIELDLMDHDYALTAEAAALVFDLLKAHNYETGQVYCSSTIPITYAVATAIRRDHASEVADQLVEIASNPRYQVKLKDLWGKKSDG